MSTFLVRTLSGFIYALLVIGSILTGRFVFAFLIFLFLIMGLVELRNLVKGFDSLYGKITLFGINILFYIGWMLYSFDIAGKDLLVVIFVFCFSMLISNLFVKKEYPGKFFGNLILSLAYLAIPMIIINQLFFTADKTYTAQILLGMFVIIWLYDSFAYISGALFGKHKLAPNISPKKTWEGAFGGLLFSLVGAYAMSQFFIGYSIAEWFGLAVVVVICGTFGDLFESYLKRKAGLKESGSIMPGHGGILDRLDSLLFAAPFVYIYILLV